MGIEYEDIDVICCNCMDVAEDKCRKLHCGEYLDLLHIKKYFNNFLLGDKIKA